MKEFIEKLIGRLEEEREWAITHGTDASFRKGRISGINTAKRIVNQLAEEYNNTSTNTSSGWIACSERLPEKNQRCLVSYKGNINSEGIEEKYVDIDRFEGTRFSFFGVDKVIAWMPLPAPYKEGE